jgi:hypothetical protein
MAQERSPEILEIYRDRLKPGQEAAFKAIEEDAARICADLQCPHPHLAIESLTGPKEVWWLNAFESEAEKQRVYSEYMNNRALLAALDRITKGKEGLTETPEDIFVKYRADLSRGAVWKVAGARFFAATVTREDLQIDGSVFEAPDGTFFILRPARTEQECEAVVSASAPETRVFAVRPYWGMPAEEWIAADPEFWKSNPNASGR